MSDSDSNNLIDAFEISDDDYAPAAKKTKAPPAAKKPAQKKPAAPKATKAKAGGSAPAKRLSDKENGDAADGIFETIDHATQGGRKSLSVEQIYQRLSQLDHVLVRPDTYIGSVEKHTEAMWVYNMEAEKFDYREITYVPGFYKIFDEILVNAADNKQRDRHMNTIRITIDKEKNEIAIYNNGKGVPVVEHKYEKMYVPELIFGTLLTSSNYDDSDKKVTGGRNGYGAKLCNIFSKKFVVETSCRDSKHSFKQTWTNNMNKDVPAHKIKKPDIGDAKNDDFTKVTFQPDLKRFGMDHFEKDMVDLMARRAFDIAGSCKGVRVFLNNKRLPCVGFKEYVNTFVKDMVDEHGEHMKVEYEACGSRWEVGVTHSDSGFKQISFVNSIATTKGGRHVDHVVDQLIKKLIEHIKAKLKKSGTQLRPHQVKQHLFVFVNCLIENPAFDSQTKETMTLQAKNFGSKCEISDKFIKNVIKNLKVVDNIMSWVRFKQQDQLDKKCHTTKHTKLKGVPKLEDANNAGTKRSTDCVLILTEGDSAKSLAVSGLGVVGRDNYGVFPLRGKMLNVRDASHKQQLANEEVNNLIKILGLQFKKNYATENDYKSLRYGKIMIMADQDQDGSHIKGLIINFVHHFWPSLVRQQNFVEEFITPIVKVQKGNQEQSFYSLPEYEDWKRDTPNWHLWRIKYYKGLGTSTSKEAKEYFSDMWKNRIAFKYRQGDDDAIEMAFSKNKIEERKNWLTNWMEERKRRKELGLGEVYLYEKDTRAISYRDFVDKELVLFSNLDNERSIPSMVDGLKPGQRKVMFTCFKRNLKKEIKVAQLAGSVAEHSAYHHGEASLMSTIIGLAQDFVGSNNINLLTPNGQFGTRLQGGKDAASPRYIFTALSPLARVIFHEHDDAVLRFLRDDNQRIEPEWYCPCVPMVLINGADGIGTGWSTRVLNYNPMDVVQNLRRLLRDEDPKAMKPWFKNFRGHIEKLGDRSVAVSGVVSTFDDGQTMEVTELPIRMWTEAYKTGTLEPMLTGSEKIQPVITDFKEYHTDTTVRFVVKAPQATLAKWLREGLHKMMKLSSTMSTNNMVLFDADGVLRRYETELDILKDFYIVRLRKYDERRAFLIGKLGAEAKKLSEQARFIMLKIKGEISLENKKKRDIVKQLIEHKFARDPVKAWTEEYTKKRNEAEGSLESADEDAEEADEDDVPTEADKKAGEAAIKGYEYLVNQYLIKLSWEEKEKLEKERDEKQSELRTVESKTAKDLWSEDLDRFEMEYKKEIDRQQEEASTAKVATLSSAATKAGKGGAKKGRKVDVAETRPSKDADEVDPDIGYLKAKVEETTRRAEDKKLGIVSGRGKKKKEEESLMSRIEKRRESQGKSKPSPSIKRYLKAPGEQKPKEELLDSDIEMVEDDDAPAASKPVKRPAKHDDEDSASKKRKKTNKEPWETDEEDEEVDISEDSDDGSEVVPVDRARRERKPVKYDVDADVEDVNGATGSNQQSDEESSSKPSTSKPPSSRNSLFDDGISDDDDKPVAAKQKKKPMVIEDDESDYKSDDDKPKQKAKGKGRSKKAVASDSDDSEYDDFIAKSDEEEVPRKKSPPPKAKPSSKPAAKQKARKDSDSEDNFLAQSDEDDEDFTPEKKPAAKTKAAAKSGPAAKKPVANGTTLKQFEFDADSDDENLADKPTTSDAVCDLFDSPSPSPSPVKVTKKAAAKKKRVVSSDSEGGDSDFRADSPVERLVADRPGRTARATKKVDYNVDEAGSDSE